MEEFENNEEKKNVKIEIVKGNPKDLNISEVKDNLTFEVVEDKPNQKIIVPENQKKCDNNCEE